MSDPVLTFSAVLGDKPLPPVEAFDASDGVSIVYRRYRASEPRVVLVLYHGGGAHSGAGYGPLAAGLCAHGIEVYTPDLRGHGASGGPRGDAPRPDRVWSDVNEMVVRVRRDHVGRPLVLGGHSSGAGLALNFSDWPGREPVDAYALLSPELGFRARVARSGRPFARASIAPFVVNAMSGGRWMGHARAVRFDYPAEILAADRGLVDGYTVHMANAVTPRAPKEQLAALDRPLGAWIGADDEIIDPAKLAAFLAPRPLVVLPKTSHLSVLASAPAEMVSWVVGQATRSPS